MSASTGIKTTRMELFALKKRKKIAEKGRDLLQEKQDALLMEFFEHVLELKKAQEKAAKVLQKAYNAFAEAQAMLGPRTFQQIALSSSFEQFSVELKIKNIMGVKIPAIFLSKKSDAHREYNLFETVAKLDEAITFMNEAIEHIITLAEVESAIRELALAIISTRRRVNCLNHIIIPRIKSSIKYISMKLEEYEREDFFRLKRVKAAIERRKAAKEIEAIAATSR